MRSIVATSLVLTALWYSVSSAATAFSSSTEDPARLIGPLVMSIPTGKANARIAKERNQIISAAFCLLRRHADPPRSEYRRDRPSVIAPWPLSGRRSPHLASHVW